MDTIQQIGIIGAGELGQALGRSLSRARVEILYYDKDVSKTTTASLEDVVKTCTVLLLCVPSWANEEVAKQIDKAAHPMRPGVVISFSKGVGRHFTTVDRILAEHVPGNYAHGLIYGPMIAEEIALGKLAAGVLALSDPGWQRSLHQLFASIGVCLDVASDLHSVAIAGALKNLYAIAFGMAAGMHLGVNATGKLAVLALHEMKQLLRDLQGDPHVAEGLAGLGDLLATGMSNSSFNFQVGRTIAQGIADPHVKSEGLVALKELSGQITTRQYPLLHTLNRMVYHYEQPEALKALLETSL